MKPCDCKSIQDAKDNLDHQGFRINEKSITVKPNTKELIVGDLHGDWGSLNTLITKKRPNAVLQCGDFGWWPQISSMRRVLYRKDKPWSHKGIKCHGTEVYFCDGNHENHWDLAMEVAKSNGNVVSLYENVFYVPRGNTITLNDGRVVLFVGGAESVDKHKRTIGLDWYPTEVISAIDFEVAMGHGRVDIVISHTCPTEFIPKKYATKEKVNDPSRKALSGILHHYRPALWYFAHWHTHDAGVYQNTRWTCLDYPGHGGRWWVTLDS